MALGCGVLDAKTAQTAREVGQKIVFLFFAVHARFSERDFAETFAVRIVLVGHDGFIPDV
jgi:hypothetical protein